MSCGHEQTKGSKQTNVKINFILFKPQVSSRFLLLQKGCLDCPRWGCSSVVGGRNGCQEEIKKWKRKEWGYGSSSWSGDGEESEGEGGRGSLERKAEGNEGNEGCS